MLPCPHCFERTLRLLCVVRCSVLVFGCSVLAWTCVFYRACRARHAPACGSATCVVWFGPSCNDYSPLLCARVHARVSALAFVAFAVVGSFAHLLLGCGVLDLPTSAAGCSLSVIAVALGSHDVYVSGHGVQCSLGCCTRRDRGQFNTAVLWIGVLQDELTNSTCIVHALPLRPKQQTTPGGRVAHHPLHCG